MSVTNYDPALRQYKRKLPLRSYGDGPMRRTEKYVPDEEQEEEEKHPVNLASAWTYRNRSYKAPTSKQVAWHPPHSPFSAVALPPFSFTPKDRIDNLAHNHYPEVVEIEHIIRAGLGTTQRLADELPRRSRLSSESDRFKSLRDNLCSVETNRMKLWVYTLFIQTMSLVRVEQFISAQDKANGRIRSELEAELKPYEEKPRSLARQFARDDFSHIHESHNLRATLSALEHRHLLLVRFFNLINGHIQRNHDIEVLTPELLNQVTKKCCIPPIPWAEDHGFLHDPDEESGEEEEEPYPW